MTFPQIELGKTKEIPINNLHIKHHCIRNNLALYYNISINNRRVLRIYRKRTIKFTIKYDHYNTPKRLAKIPPNVLHKIY